MKFIVEAYNNNNQQIPGNNDGQGEYVCSKYKLTSWYHMLPWRFSIRDVSYYLIRNVKGDVLERVDRVLPVGGYGGSTSSL